MFFNDVFNEHISSNLPPDITFIVEDTVTQILTNCDIAFLRKALTDKNLSKAFFDELVFYGPVAKPYLSKVELYLKEQENTLSHVAEILMEKPDDRILRERLSSPSLQAQASFPR